MNAPPAEGLALDLALHWERTAPDKLYMTQPLGGGQLATFTWGEAVGEARRMAGHIAALDLPEGSRIALLSKNTAWWLMADLAIWMAGHVSVPLYPTLDAETVKYVLEHSGAELLFVGKLDVWDAMKAGVPEELSCIAMPLSPPTDFPKWEDLAAAATPLADVAEPKADEMATIVYTSGSTGRAKGVMISFGAMALSARGLGGQLAISDRDRILSYLPLSHVFERWIVEMGSLAAGFEVYFAESLTTFVSDIKRARPTLFISVPRLWQKFHLGVLAKMPQSKLDLLLRIPIVSGIIKKKVLGGLGLDQVRFAGSGSAPIPPELLSWYRNLGLELLEGYGMTENFCYSHVSKPGRARVGYVGEGYDGVDTVIAESGEILVKSPGSMLGYYREPELTAEAFTEDGYLRTGDRGEVDELGRLRITGRVKELFKTSKGKYVSPAPIENKLQVSNDLEMVCVAGSGAPQPHAIIVLSEESRKQADSGGREAVQGRLAEHLSRVNAELPGYERLAFVAVVADEWAIENGFLTPTMKLKRAAIEDAYGPLSDGWYEAGEAVLWHGA